VRLRLAVRDLVLCSWPVDPAAIERVAPAGLAPAMVGGRHLVSVVALRFGAGRLGRVPTPPFSQLNVRTYVEHDGEPTVLFLRAYATAGGLAGILFGAPFRHARIHVEPGLVRAPGLGLRIRFRLGEPTDPGELGGHERGLFEAGGLRRFDVERGPAEWRAAEPDGEIEARVLAALGVDPAGPPNLLYATGAAFVTSLPPSSSASRPRR
jgi:hypothetical protein